MLQTPLQTADSPPPPSHVAIIMDGNGRWARQHGLPRIEGHRRGAESVRVAIRSAIDHGVSYLTLYGFSSENWRRPADEVRDLMGLLRFYLRSEIAALNKNGIALKVIGDRDKLDNDIQALIEEGEAATSGNARLTLIMALSYGGRDEIVQAARRLGAKAAAGDIAPDDIDERTVSGELYTAGIPDPDLLIRTSGERRISNFLLWQLAYAEFVFIDTLWPEFSEDDFHQAMTEYQRRERRFGGTGV